MSELKHVYYRGTIFRQSWAAARWHAKHHGGKPRQYLRHCLRQAWADAKKNAQKVAESRARVAAYIAEVRAKRLLEGPAKPLPPIPRRTLRRAS